MATTNVKYIAATNLTCTLASLAASSTLVAGQIATQSDNSSNLYDDYLLSGKVTTGTSPTAGTIEVWVIPELDDSTMPDGASTTNAAYSVTGSSRDILTAEGVLAWSVATDTTSNRAYYMRKTSVAALFGGVCPRKFSVFVTHSTVAALNATAGNHQLTTQGVQETIA
jgi:hypothetical protein